LSIAELQVSRVRAAFVQKPFETSIGFAVHSLLVVDALQMLGHDYELLVASHNSLWSASFLLLLEFFIFKNIC